MVNILDPDKTPSNSVSGLDTICLTQQLPVLSKTKSKFTNDEKRSSNYLYKTTFKQDAIVNDSSTLRKKKLLRFPPRNQDQNRADSI